MTDNADYWIDLSDYDIETAKAMLQTGRYLYVGFMCHQAVEKSLKAIIACDCEEGDLPPKIHHLLKLADRAGVYGKMSQGQQKFVGELNPLNVESRYPGCMDLLIAELTHDSCADMIRRTEALLCWIKTQL